MQCPSCDAEVSPKAAECPECGKRLKGKKGGKLIPTQNLSALIGYYVGVVGLIPYVALLLGPLAIILGVAGLVHGIVNPRARASWHSIAAILEGIVGLVGTAVVAWLITKGYLDDPFQKFRK